MQEQKTITLKVDDSSIRVDRNFIDDLIRDVPELKDTIDKQNSSEALDIITLMQQQKKEHFLKRRLLERCLPFNIEKKREKFEQDSTIKDIAVAPDGSHIFIIRENRIVTCWNRQDASTTTHSPALAHVIKVPGNEYIIYVHQDKKNWALFNTRTRKILPIINLSHELRDVRVAPDGSYVVSIYEDSTIDVTKFSNQTIKKDSSNIKFFKITPDSSQIIIMTQSLQDNNLLLWSRETAKLTHKLQIPSDDDITSFAITPDSTRFAVGFQSGSIKIWNIKEKKLTYEAKPYAKAINFIALSPDAQQAIIGIENTAQYIALSDQPQAQSLGNIESIQKIESVPGHVYVAIHSAAKTAQIVDMIPRQIQRRDFSEGTSIEFIMTAVDRPYILTRSTNGVIKIFDPEDPDSSAAPICGFQAGLKIKTLEIAPESAQIFTLSQDGTLRIWGENLSKLSTEQLLSLVLLFKAQKDPRNLTITPLIASLPKHLQSWFTQRKSAAKPKVQSAQILPKIPQPPAVNVPVMQPALSPTPAPSPAKEPSDSAQLKSTSPEQPVVMVAESAQEKGETTLQSAAAQGETTLGQEPVGKTREELSVKSESVVSAPIIQVSQPVQEVQPEISQSRTTEESATPIEPQIPTKKPESASATATQIPVQKQTMVSIR